MRTAACVLSAAVTLAAQDPGAPIRTEVNYIRVDMYPVANGRPVADLRQDEIELLEDGVPQTLEQFERVSVTSGPGTARREPSTLAGMRRAAQDPRARVLVLFLDPRHVDLEGSMRARQPLIDALNRLVGGDDLVAVMTPEMSARGLTFTRRPRSIEDLLATHWGTKDWLGTRDRTEAEYEACYNIKEGKGLAERMIPRRREVLVLDALEDLVTHLGGLREERKAVITISDGWPLYGPDPQLMRPLVDPATGDQRSIPIDPVGRDPITGRPGTPNTSSVVLSSDGMGTLDRAKCENDRLDLSELRNEQRFIEIMQAANRANVSFYPIAPGGFSASYVPLTPQRRALEMMASATDGLAIAQPVNLDAGVRRIVDDLSSYYLLGYYSPVKADGKFHTITVRVKRPGVQVRARPGYMAASAAEAAGAPVKPAPVETAHARLVTQALGTLSGFTRELPLRVRVAAAWTATGEAIVRAVADLPRTAALGDDWSKGGEVEATLVDSGGKTVATARSAVDPVLFVAPLELRPSAPLPAGSYRVLFRAKGASALGSSEAVSFDLAAAPLGTGVMFVRRFGARDVPTADVRFRRTERIALEAPAGLGAEVAARLLNRAGDVMNVPVSASIRSASDGTRWQRVEIALAPLAAGDYLIESTSGPDRTLTAFRVIP